MKHLLRNERISGASAAENRAFQVSLAFPFPIRMIFPLLGTLFMGLMWMGFQGIFTFSLLFVGDHHQQTLGWLFS